LLAAGVASGQDGPAFVEARSGDPDGRMTVLIPGLASSGDVWAQTAVELAAYDVRALTLAGFAGVSPRAGIAEDTPLIAVAAQAVADMLAAEDVHNVALVGHSLGAQVALQAAALAPGRVNQVVVVDSAPFYAGLVQPGVTPEQAAAFAQAAAAQLSALPEDAFRAQQAAGLAIYSKDPDCVAVLREWSDASDRATIIAGFGEVAGGDFRAVLPNVRASILVLVAFDMSMGVNRDVLESVYRDQYSAALDARITLIGDSYHFIMHDRRDAFLAALAAFLEEGA
jgi:pimeloyl-ACP methyl ester carboxylesterase